MQLNKRDVTKLINDFKNDVFKNFDKSEIEGILLFGSYSSGFVNPFSDVDLWVILKRYSIKDFIKFRKIYKKFSPDGLSLTVKWRDELKFKKDSFVSHKGNGQFLVWELQRAKIIFGNNPFLRIKLSNDLIYQSVIVKIEKLLTEYRKFVIKGIKVDLSLQRDLLKHIYRSLRYMLLARGIIPNPKTFFYVFKKTYPKLLFPSDLRFLQEKYSDNDPTNWTLTRNDLLRCIDILRRFYKELISNDNID